MEGCAMSKGSIGEADMIRLRQNIRDLLRRRVIEAVQTGDIETARLWQGRAVAMVEATLIKTWAQSMRGRMFTGLRNLTERATRGRVRDRPGDLTRLRRQRRRRQPHERKNEQSRQPRS